MENSRAGLGPRAAAPPGEIALSSQRLRVLQHVRAHAPVRVADAAAALDLHPNTAREHLDALTGLGLVDSSTEGGAGRGRPARLYRSAAAPTGHEYAALATALAGHLARTSAHPEAEAREAGAEWGRELGVDRAEGDGRRTVLDGLTRLGFDPKDDGPVRGIALRRCPLLDAARRHPAVVCQVHLGLVDGMLDGFDIPTAATRLIPFAEPGACRLFLPEQP